MVQALMHGSIAIINYDDVNVRNMSAKTAARVLYYGLGEGAAVRGSDIRGDAVRGLAFTLSYAGQAQRIQLRLPGAHGVMIALAAAAAGCPAQIGFGEIRAALEGSSPPK